MGIVGSISAGMLSVVFFVASAAKLRQPDETSAGFVSMGLPRWIARPVASFEMLVAILIVTRPRFGGPVAFATLFVFTLFLLRVLARTRSMGVGTVRCNCFGGAARVTGGSVVRNLALLIGAGLASTTDHLHVTLPAVLTVGMAVGTGAVLGQLAAVKSLIGQLFPKLRIDEGMTR